VDKDGYSSNGKIVPAKLLPLKAKDTLLLRSESPSGMCAKLHTVAASNNRDHTPQSLYYCWFVPHVLYVVLFLAHILFMGNSAFSVMPAERL